jgi:hypothetical protein
MSPLEKNDHPELETSDLLDEDGIVQYQPLIGILQWTITLGRFDVGTAVMTMSAFRVAPRVGHLARLRRICGYLVRFSEGCLRVRMEKLDYSGLSDYDQSWLCSVYGDVENLCRTIAPHPEAKVSAPRLTKIPTCTTTWPLGELSLGSYTSSIRPPSTGSQRSSLPW